MVLVRAACDCSMIVLRIPCGTAAAATNAWITQTIRPSLKLCWARIEERKCEPQRRVWRSEQREEAVGGWHTTWTTGTTSK